MSDVDYEELFHRGQLIWTEPHMREMLDRYYVFFSGTPSMQTFKEKYMPYLLAVHPEFIAEKVAKVPAEIFITDEQATQSELDPDIIAVSAPKEDAPQPEARRKAGRPKKSI